MMHMAYALERLFGGNRFNGKMVWVIDLRGMGYRDLNPSMGATAIPMFSRHYPERMGQIVVIDPFALVHGFIKALMPLVDPVTKAKITFLRGAAEQQQYVVNQGWTKEMSAWLAATRDLPAQPGAFPDVESRALGVNETALELQRCLELTQQGTPYVTVPPNSGLLT
eukprot:FR741389.1.p1 GENE.FR741389.1~~FR741389.1.p1  ORF type:complete len:182 (+),score=14.30 FR741389.1:46-546(+)